MTTKRFLSFSIKISILVLAGFFLFNYVKAISTTDYQNYTSQANEQYQAALAQAQAQYQAAVDAAAQTRTTLMSQATTSDQIDKVEAVYDKAIEDAEKALETNRKIAYQNYQAQRRYARDTYIIGNTSATPPTTCTKKTVADCAAAGLTCGYMSDGCDGQVYCGQCPTTLPPASPATGSATIPAGVTVTTMSPQAFMSRYAVYCGVVNTGSIASGQTKYYKIDMTKWIEWQRAYFGQYKIALQPTYQSCNQQVAGATAYYNAHCRNGVLDQSTYASYSDFAGDVWVKGSDWCTNLNGYPSSQSGSCNQWLASQTAAADQQLAAKEALYTSGNYNTVFRSPIGFGSDSYVGSAGTEGGDTWLQVAAGYDQVPVYANITNFIRYYFNIIRAQITSPISASNPIAAVEGDIVCSGIGGYCTGNGEQPFVTLDSISATGANSIYLMIHNQSGVARTLLIEFYCPDAVAK